MMVGHVDGDGADDWWLDGLVTVGQMGDGWTHGC